MKVLSVNVGLPREVVAGDEVVLTSIFKEPVSGRVPIRDHNLAGNQQADLRVHGGVSKAVYAYPSEHYPYWREQLDRPDLTWGNFGENLTIEGLLEDAVHLGDRLRIGSAELVVTQPRLPCFKLGIRLSRPDVVKSFMASRRSGFYLAVASEGDIAADDAIEIVARDPDAVSIRELLAIHQRERQDTERLRRVVAHPALSDAWRNDLGKRLREPV
jgi:MOSC domain-containing protein YiiM